MLLCQKNTPPTSWNLRKRLKVCNVSDKVAHGDAGLYRLVHASPGRRSSGASSGSWAHWSQEVTASHWLHFCCICTGFGRNFISFMYIFSSFYHCLLFGRHFVQHYVFTYCIFLAAELCVLARYMLSSSACLSVRLSTGTLECIWVWRVCVSFVRLYVPLWFFRTSLHIWSVLVTGRVFVLPIATCQFLNAV